jgi:hypothetical protein
LAVQSPDAQTCDESIAVKVHDYAKGCRFPLRCTYISRSAKNMESLALPLTAAALSACAGYSLNALQPLETPRVSNMHTHAIGVAVRSERSERVQLVMETLAVVCALRHNQTVAYERVEYFKKQY